MKVDLLNGANLAYIGDAYFELFIRKYLLLRRITNLNDLHNRAVQYVSAKSHNMIIGELVKILNKEEMNIFKRGRNYKYRSRKNANRIEHINSTGFEAVIGYLYLKEDFSRLNYLIDHAIALIEAHNE